MPQLFPLKDTYLTTKYADIFHFICMVNHFQTNIIKYILSRKTFARSHIALLTNVLQIHFICI